MPPIRRIEYVNQPYAGTRYTPDTSRLTALYTRMGEALAENALRRGEITARGLQSLGQIFSDYQQGRREQQAMTAAEQRRQRERQEDRTFTAEQQRLEREARKAERDETERVRSEERAYRRGADVAAEVGAGPMSEAQLEDVLGGPAAGRARYEFGPGTAEGPTLDPTKEQRDLNTIRQQIERFGGTVGPNGQIVMPPKPEQPPNPTEATLALRAAQGDKAAAEALRLMRPPTTATAADKPSVWVSKGNDMRFVTPTQAAAMSAEGWRSGNTREQGRPVISGDANRIADFDTSMDDLEVLRGAVADPGTVAKIQSWMPTWVSEITGGWSDDAKSQQAVIDRVRQVIGKALEGGVLRKEDEEKYKAILPVLGDPKQVALNKIQGLEDAITKRRQTLLDALGDAGYDVTRYNERQRGQRIGTGVTAVPDLIGLQPGNGRTFESGPFAGQTWTVDAQGTPRKVGG